jgi:hypothetical protein
MEIKEMRVIKDGNCWSFVLPDFVNLQESPAVFYDEGNTDMDSIWEELHSKDPNGFELE